MPWFDLIGIIIYIDNVPSYCCKITPSPPCGRPYPHPYPCLTKLFCNSFYIAKMFRVPSTHDVVETSLLCIAELPFRQPSRKVRDWLEDPADAASDTKHFLLKTLVWVHALVRADMALLTSKVTPTSQKLARLQISGTLNLLPECPTCTSIILMYFAELSTNAGDLFRMVPCTVRSGGEDCRV